MTHSTTTKLKSLQSIIGSWFTEGEVIDSNGKETRIKGIDTYEWALGKAFIIHKVDVVIGEENIESVEIISEPEDGTNSFKMLSSDLRGEQTEMNLHVISENVFEILGDKMKAELNILKEGKSMKAQWYRSDDNQSWQPWMTMRFTKC